MSGQASREAAIEPSSASPLTLFIASDILPLKVEDAEANLKASILKLEDAEAFLRMLKLS